MISLFIIKKVNRAFSLIELLLVVAIIGILSSITLVSLNQSKIKARDARIILGIRQLVPFAEFIYNKKNSYADLCDDGEIRIDYLYQDELTSINMEISNNGGYVFCYADTNKYCIYSRLNISGVGFFCIDNTGKAIITDIDPGTKECNFTGNMTCPSN